MPDKCHCVDFQILKLQELPDSIPQGEIPRHITLFCDRYLCEKVVPGNRVFVLGIYSIKKIAKPSTVSHFIFGVTRHNFECYNLANNPNETSTDNFINVN